MAQTIEVNLVDVLTRIETKVDKLTEDVAQLKSESIQTNRRLDNVDKRFEEINKRFDEVNKRFEEVNKRFDEVNTRLNTMTLGFLGIVGVLVAGLLTIVGKVVFFPNI